MKEYKKLAVFGGTFSPVHNGHLRAFCAYCDAVLPDIAYVIPTAQPPHKQRSDSATDAQRMQMLKLAFEPLAAKYPLLVSDIEIRRGGKSYTVDTVASLLEVAEKIVIYCGTDMFLTLEEWHDFETLFKTATIAYMQREDDSRFAAAISEKASTYREKYAAQLIELPALPIEISSSRIRKMVQSGEDIQSFVPPAVAAYISQNRLYTGV